MIFSIHIFIDVLNPKFWNNKKYIEKTQIPKQSFYKELLYKSFLFLYGDDNKLYFIKEFSLLTVPRYDIGSNYHLEGTEEEKILSGINLIEWKDFTKLREIRVA